jgi:hypothetical protein
MPALTRLIPFALLLAAAGSAVAASPDKEAIRELKTYYDSLPAPKFPAFDEAQAMALVTLPLSCVDRPQALPEQRVDYLWVHDTKPHLAESYDKTRAFYGCFDWHSAVNSTWTMVAVLKQFPHIPVGPLIREKLKEHLGKKNVEGEMEFFKAARNFEVPYGYAWLLRLYAELVTWDDPEAKTWAQNLAPMVEQFSKKLATYYKDLPFPTRTGMHPNTAFSINLLLDYTQITKDTALREVATQTARRFFANDRACATSYEPQGTDFLSPCLAEAQLMSKVMERDQFRAWLNDFLPPLYSQDFKPLTAPIDVSAITKDDLQAGKSHLIGVAFSRSMAMADILKMLPADDARVPVLARLATINGWSGFQALSAAGYYGSHWLATYAVLCTRSILAAEANQAPPRAAK